MVTNYPPNKFGTEEVTHENMCMFRLTTVNDEYV
jgi:hypothetical protein